MAVIKSGLSTDQLSIDPASKAARVTLYDISGNLISLAADHTQANSPSSVQLTDGTSFYKATTPTDTQPISGTVVANAGIGTFIVDASGHTVPVSGTFFQATQPVSIAATINADVIDRTARLLGHVNVDNFPATQSVSGTITANAGTGTFIVDASGHTVPVSGTFFQAVQPVSGTIIANAGTGTFQTDDVSSAPTGGAVPAESIYIGANKAGVLTGLSLDANGNLSVNISDVAGNAATAKGIQPAAAIPTQDFKDSGRTYVILYADRIAGATTEALITMSVNKGGTVTTGTSYTVTAGKTFRIQSVNAEILNTTTVANRVLIRVRSAASVLVTSPIIAMAMAASSAALATSGATDPHSFADGLEISSGQQIGVSQLSTVTTAGIVSMTIVGYEY